MRSLYIILLLVAGAHAAPPVAGGGTCLTFDGTDDYVLTGLRDTLAAATVEAWISPDDTGGCIIDNGGAGSGVAEMQIHFEGDTLIASRWFDNGGEAKTVLPPGGWHHVAAAFTDSTIHLYVDGVIADSATGLATGDMFSNFHTWCIGSARAGTRWPYCGSIDEVRVWDHVRTPAEIADNMNAPLAGNDSGLVAYWRFDEAAGDSAADATGLSTPAVLTNMAAGAWRTYGPWNALDITEGDTVTLAAGLDPDGSTVTFSTPTAPAHGVAAYGSGTKTVTYYPHREFAGTDSFQFALAAGGEADSCWVRVDVAGVNDTPYAAPMLRSGLEFDGVDDYVSATPAVPPAQSAYTVEAWIKPDRMGQQGIVGWGDFSSVSYSNALFVTSTGILNYWEFWNYEVSTGDISGAWHHVAATYDGAYRRIYLDGVLVGSTARAGGTSAGAWNFAIGRVPGKNFGAYYPFDGCIDEVRIWSVSRTPAQICGAMYRTLDGDETGLVAYYPMDDNRGSGTRELTATGADGTLHNMSLAWGPGARFDTLTVLAGDTAAFRYGYDAESDTCSSALVSGPRHGSVIIDTVSREMAYVSQTGFAGYDTVVITVTDSAGVTDTVAVVLDVRYLNEAPSFTHAGDDTVLQDAGAVTVPGWASSISSGPDDSLQTVRFVLTAVTSGLFAVQPAVDSVTGNLAYTPAAGKYGQSKVYVRAYDDGGTWCGGTDSSALDSFTVYVVIAAANPPVAGLGRCLAFDGTDDYVTLTGLNDLRGTELTVEYLFRGTDADPVFYCSYNYGQQFINAGYTMGEYHRIRLANDDYYAPTAGSGQNPEDGEWHHCAFTFDCKDTTFPGYSWAGWGFRSYFDGEQAGSSYTVTYDSIAFIGDDATLGAKLPYSTRMNGVLDEVRIWRTARTADQIRESYRSGVSGTEPDLAAYYRFDDPNGSSLRDWSGNGFTGAFMNMDGSGWQTNDLPLLLRVPEDDSAAFVAGYDVTDDPLVITVLDSCTRGRVTTFDDSVTVRYVPDHEFYGYDTLRYSVTDTVGMSDTAVAVFRLLPVNDAPSFAHAGDDTVTEDSGPDTITGWASSMSTGPANEADQALSFRLTTAQAHLFAAQPAVDPVTGDLSYEPAPDAYGTVVVYVTLFDDGGTEWGGCDSSVTDSFTITILVLPDDPPAADDTTYSLNEDETFVFSAGVETDGGPAVIETLAGPWHGTAVLIDSTLEISYQPVLNWYGVDSVSFYIEDTSGLRDTGLVRLHVASVNDLPVISSPATDSAARLALYMYVAEAADVESTVTYRYESYPEWADTVYRVLYGTPPDSALADTSFILIVSDGEAEETLCVALAMGDGDGKVPVALTSFTARTADGDVVLEWETSAERDNLGWDVERGPDPVGTFDVVNGSLVPGAGTTQQPRAYAFTDTTAGSGMWYYRLVQYDLGGERTYSYIVAAYVPVAGLDVPAEADASGVRFVNPGRGIELRFDPRFAESLRVLVADMRGRVVDYARPREGCYRLSGLEPGVYYVTLYDGMDRQVLRVLLTD